MLLLACAAGLDFAAVALYSPEAVSLLSQNLHPVVPGAIYRLSYMLAIAFNVVNSFWPTNSWNVSVGGVEVDSFYGTPSYPEYVTRSVLVTIPANATSTNLVFAFRQVMRPQQVLTKDHGYSYVGIENGKHTGCGRAPLPPHT
jgi:hypothetical protein